MKTIGFVISRKENERRRVLLPADVTRVRNRGSLVFQESYATHLGIADSEYLDLGCSIAPASEVYRCDIICNPKAPEPAERELFGEGQTLFGWVHAVQGRSTVDFLIGRRMSAIAWEDMFEGGRHCFWRNNEIAGEAAILHAINFLGRLPHGLKAALIGRGNCGRGAYRIMAQLGMEVTVYDRQSVGLLRKEIGQFDLLVNAVMWDVFRQDHLVYREDLGRMRAGALIVDVSCDECMGIESSRPTPIYEPVYEVDGILHYVVDHTPAIYYRAATEAISRAVAPYIDELVESRPGGCLRRATVIERGHILDRRIARFQGRDMTGF